MITLQWNHGCRYSDKKRQIQTLIDKGQPFALAKYETTAIMISDRSKWSYEIILWQTRTNEETTDCLTLSKNDFDALIDDFSMKRLHSEPYGEIWGVNDYIQTLSKEYTNTLKKCDEQINTLHKSYYIASLSKEKRMAILENLKLAHQQKKKIDLQFYDDFEIINWNLCTTKKSNN